MARFELSKTVEAAKLKPSGVPLGEEGTIPFGAIVDNVQEDGSWMKFTYLGQQYRCRPDVLEGALKPVGTHEAPAAASAASASAGPPAPTLLWEELKSDVKLRRSKVPGGWLLSAASGIAFYPDPDHEWDGASMP
ncbi:MAG TPA: hypothetical protein VGF59_04225 [Bryobacteraceae bacterium]|jgi:hypothetical protein